MIWRTCRLTLIALLIGAVAVLAALATEELALAAAELAPWADDDRLAAMDEATEAGRVVATPPKVVVTRLEVDVAEAITEAETSLKKFSKRAGKNWSKNTNKQKRRRS